MRTIRLLLRRNICSHLILLVFLGVLATVVLNWLFADRFKRSLVFDEADDDIQQPSYDFTSYADFAKALRDTADKDRMVVMALVDSGYIEMAYNFYYSSIIKHGIDNFLFVALDHMACERMHAAFPDRRIRCFVYKELPTAIHATLYDSKEFKEKIYLRRFLALQAIRLGYDVLLTDLDTTFVQNPIKDIVHTCSKKKCDIAAQWDEHLEKYNAGFLFVRSTNASIKFYQRLARYEMSHGVGQMALNAAIREHAGRKSAPTVVSLNHKKYRIGITLFPRNECPERKVFKDIYVIHNNYIMEQSNKIYRLKECMLWDWDGPEGYYSDPTRRYLTIRNAGTPGFAEHQGILNALSLSKLLHRTLILPRFDCKRDGKCNLLQRIYDHSHLHFLKRFQNATGGNFRESSFLHNPRVPEAIKTSVSPLYHINFREIPQKDGKHDTNILHLTPKDLDEGPTAKEILHWFGHNRDKVLHFDNLVGHFAHLDHNAILGENLVKIVRQL